MESNPLKEVRDARKAISAECDDDPVKVFAYYLAHQEESKRSGNFRFVNKPEISDDAPSPMSQDASRRLF